jgi:DNA-directed RNA polymerase subunit RPC12/RpoP
MTVTCVSCGRHVGIIEGRLLKGWSILCPDCEARRKAAVWMKETEKAGDMPEFLKGLFRGEK